MSTYVLSKHLEIEQCEDDELTIAHSLHGTRLRINASTYRFILRFAQPQTLEAVVNGKVPNRILPVFETFKRNHFLVDTDKEESITDKVIQKVGPCFFNCPQFSAQSGCDAGLLGVPFDYGNTQDPGARFGPQAIRRITSSYFPYTIDSESLEPRGWYDNDLDRFILKGVNLADMGDVFVYPGMSFGLIFEKIRSCVTSMFEHKVLPVILGGDHSITYAAVSGLKSEVDIIHIDAHSDLAPLHHGIENHHGNVMSRVLNLKHVGRIYQIGLRGISPVTQFKSDPRIPMKLSPRQFRKLGLEQVLKNIPADRNYYVSFDIDALDPSIAPGTSTPVSGGLGFSEAKELLAAIGEQRHCLGFDLVEVNPKRDPSDVTAMVAAELMMVFMDSCFRYKGGSHA